MTARASIGWRERDRLIRQAPLAIFWGGESRGLFWFVVDTEHDVVAFKGLGSLVEAEQAVIDELERREGDDG